MLCPYTDKLSHQTRVLPCSAFSQPLVPVGGYLCGSSMTYSRAAEAVDSFAVDPAVDNRTTEDAEGEALSQGHALAWSELVDRCRIYEKLYLSGVCQRLVRNSSSSKSWSIAWAMARPSESLMSFREATGNSLARVPW
jgi:hypothetical protein